uniref:Uncharacterized protein n=1 Tax=Avena sativa TaxID=4498 RepID=A0ACD6AHA4_AVESA
MKEGTLALFLLFAFASHGTWCAAAERSTAADAAAHHHLRPHLQVEAQGLHEAQGKRLLEMQSPRKLAGHAHMAGGGASGGGRNTGGGAANTRPHNSKNGGAVALPAPVTSGLALVFTTTILLAVFSF